MKRYALYLLTIGLSGIASAFAQENIKKEEFSTRYQAFVRGDIGTIGNSIVSRKGGKNGANENYDERKKMTKTNDNNVMEYIDTDGDKTTFSSSSAQFVSGYSKIGKVVFAGLYWAGTYPYERGKMVAKRFEAENKNREDFTRVMIKLPKKKYQALKGDIVFDGNKDDKLVDSPYVAFADITNIVRELRNPEGEYTVANVRSAVGTIEGGSAAGWTLVIVYELPSGQTKKIEVKDGFSVVGEEVKSAIFGNFKINENKENVLRLAGAALGVDAGVGTNRLVVHSDKTILSMSSKKRGASNFFNSTITQDENFANLREPKSTNTLGFDLFNQEVPNFENSLLPKGSTSFDVETYSKGQNFYLFMLAMSLDSDNVSLTRPVERVKREPDPMFGNFYRAGNSEDKKQPQKTEQITQTAQAKANAQQSMEVPKDVRKLNIKGTDKGFYIIIGAYSSEANSEKLVQKYRTWGMKEAKKIYFDQKKLYYICYAYAKTYQEALEKQLEAAKMFKKDERYSKLKPWILAVE